MSSQQLGGVSPSPTRVLFVAVEMSPLVKVGGLGDVTSSLPIALRRRGLDVRVALPFFDTIDAAALDLRPLGDVSVPWPDGPEPARLFEATVRGVPVYLLENQRFFGRGKIYGEFDDAERWLFFDTALLAAAGVLGWMPDVLHLHDWHAAFVATRQLGFPDHNWSSAATAYTIHNLGLPGPFDRQFAVRHGLEPRAFEVPAGVDVERAYTGMGQGILHAHVVSTVSETYAREILTPEYGFGFDGMLAGRRERLWGIVNGIDYDEFNPQTDPHLAATFGPESLERRIENKRVLQRRCGLPLRDDVCLVGMVTRLFYQKGADIAAQAMASVLERHEVQFVVLGTGDEEHHRLLTALEGRFPDKVKVFLTFDPPLGQQIYGGADAFLMPSRYEPCGLGQMIAQRYGAVPIVRRTGGLADTVQDYDGAAGSGTGFVFEQAEPGDLERALERALAVYEDADAWRAIVLRGMAQDFSWNRAASRYGAMYEAAKAAAGMGVSR